MALSTDDKVVLKEFLATKFVVEELKDLAFDAGISLAEIPQDTAAHFARELILYCERRSLLGNLIKTALSHRCETGLLMHLLAKVDDYRPRVSILIDMDAESLLIPQEDLKGRVKYWFQDIVEGEIEIVAMRRGSIHLLLSTPSDEFYAYARTQLLGGVTTNLDGGIVKREATFAERDGMLPIIKYSMFLTDETQRLRVENEEFRLLRESMDWKYSEYRFDLENLRPESVSRIVETEQIQRLIEGLSVIKDNLHSLAVNVQSRFEAWREFLGQDKSISLFTPLLSEIEKAESHWARDYVWLASSFYENTDMLQTYMFVSGILDVLNARLGDIVSTDRGMFIALNRLVVIFTGEDELPDLTYLHD